MRTGALMGMALLGATWLCACSSSPGGGSNNNSFIPCEGIEDCPPGYLCVSNVCVAEGDGGVTPDGSTDPDIEVTPDTLDFGNPLLNVAVQQSATITNAGGQDLTIFSILLEEDDADLEYDATPLGNLARVLAPGESMVVDVQLINTDEQADTGRLVINSNDLDEAMTVVPLVSELKGDGLLGTCVMESAGLYSPCVTNPELIDFGPMDSDATALQDVSVFNAGTGNTPLLVNDIYVTNNSGYVGQFHLDIVRFVEDPGNPGTYIEESLPDLSTTPFLLEVNDGAGAPEVLLIHVRFEAAVALEGQPVPPEFLVIQTDDASHPNYQIPFAGDVLCPAGWVELDGMSPWCEYECTETNGGVEDCEGIDNNCDGVIDEGCPVCGNGVLETGETCDDGNQDNTDACPDGIFGTCEPAQCGDGHIQTGVEECDDGNHDNTDACPDDTSDNGTCENAICGDGFVRSGVEGCDDGNHDNSDACPDGVFGTCAAAICGDGFIYTGHEACDDGTNNSDSVPDACRRTCDLPDCGDGVVDTGEDCEPPNVGACDASCHMTTYNPTGCYTINTVSCSCAGGAVDFDIQCVELSENAGALTILPAADPCGTGSPMSGSYNAGTFNASCTYGGLCTEGYGFSGTFSDPDNWTGTFTSSFIESIPGFCYGCVSGQCDQAITATRTTCPCP